MVIAVRVDFPDFFVGPHVRRDLQIRRVVRGHFNPAAEVQVGWGCGCCARRRRGWGRRWGRCRRCSSSVACNASRTATCRVSSSKTARSSSTARSSAKIRFVFPRRSGPSPRRKIEFPRRPPSSLRKYGFRVVEKPRQHHVRPSALDY